MADADGGSGRIVIVGGVAGGASAAARARRMDEAVEIIMLEKDEHVSFANCGLPYYIGGEIEEREKLLVAKPARFRDWLNVEVRTRSEATAIDRDAKSITVMDHGRGASYELGYDKLILAPGAAPIVPPIEGVDSSNVFTLRNVADTDAIKGYIDGNKPGRVAVIGAGYIGLEMVEMLRHRGLEVAVVELLEQVMPPLDAEMASMIEEELSAHGVELHLGNGLDGFLRAEGGRVGGVVLKDGTEVGADFVIMGIGVRPNTALAKEAGLSIGGSGGIVVNRFMQTDDPDIYAVGDAVEYEHGVLGERMRVALAGPANRAGRIAGEHAASGSAPAMSPVLGTAVVRVFSKTAAMTGLSEKTASKHGRPARAVWVPAANHAGYYPGAEPMMVKLIFDPSEGAGRGKVLGAQIVGGAGVDKRVDVLATAIGFGATVDDLTGLDLAYAPPYGSAKDPVHLAAFVAQNWLRGLDRYERPESTSEGPSGARRGDGAGDDDGVQWLDVRTAAEWDSGHLEGAIRVPLSQLRDRLSELDKARPVVTICKGGQRSYYASRVLRLNGFENVATLSGGMTMQRHAGG